MSAYWGGFNTVEERRLFLIHLIAGCSDNQIKPANFKPGGFDKATSDMFIVAPEIEVKKLIKLQLEVIDQLRKLPGNIIFKSNKWQQLEKYLQYLSREFKIHLQAREEDIPLVIMRLIKLIMADKFLRQNIAGFKTVVFVDQEHQYENRSNIVLYLAYKRVREQAQEMCQQVLAKLKIGLADSEQYAENRLPFYNFPVTKLISFIQIGTDTKFRLQKLLGRRFDILFPREYYQALVMDEDPRFYVPDCQRHKVTIRQPVEYKAPDIEAFPLIAKQFHIDSEYQPYYEFCCPACGNLHTFKCSPGFWMFDCQDCEPDNAACQAVITQQGRICVFTCQSCSQAYRIYRTDSERFSLKTFEAV